MEPPLDLAYFEHLNVIVASQLHSSVPYGDTLTRFSPNHPTQEVFFFQLFHQC